jgi:hypothetical protein
MNKTSGIKKENYRIFAEKLSKEISSLNEIKTKKRGIAYEGSKVIVNFNDHGFRSDTFKKNIDFLSAGCSFTFGIGLPSEFTWNNMLAAEHNFSHNSIGIPGGSCMDIVFNIFKYFENYGHPKFLLAFFPDFSRVYTYMDGDILNTSKMFNQPVTPVNQGFINDRIIEDLESKPNKFVSLPTNIANIFSLEYAYMLNAMHIRMLEIYCNNNHIPFAWFKWSVDAIDIQGGLEGFSNRYVTDIKKSLPRCIDGSYEELYNHTCHQEEKKIFNENSDVWYMAEDNAHYGIHWQIHVKEVFEKALKEKGLIE